MEARNGGFSRVRHESTLKAVLALATKRDDDETDGNWFDERKTKKKKRRKR